METIVNIKKNQSVDFKFAEQIDNFVDDLIIKHRDNSEIMNLMALEGTSLATSVSSRSKSLEEQGFISRFWGDLTGENQKISSRNTRDLAQSQYLGQQMLNKLAENNLITYQMVVSLGDKVNRVVVDLQDTRSEISELNQTLATFFASMRQQLESKFDLLDRNDDLIFWKETLEFEVVYKDLTYRELTRSEKIVCLANEFFRHSQQSWSSRDLSFLKTVIVSIGNHPDEEVQLSEIYKTYQEDNSLLTQLFKGDSEVPEISSMGFNTPTLMAFGKLQILESSEKHIIDTIQQYSPSSSTNAISLKLMTNFIKQETGRDFERGISMFDVVMNLVEDLIFYKKINKTMLMLAEKTEIETIRLKEHEELVASSKVLLDKNTITSDLDFNEFVAGRMGVLKAINIKGLFDNPVNELCRVTEQGPLILQSVHITVADIHKKQLNEYKISYTDAFSGIKGTMHVTGNIKLEQPLWVSSLAVEIIKKDSRMDKGAKVCIHFDFFDIFDRIKIQDKTLNEVEQLVEHLGGKQNISSVTVEGRYNELVFKLLDRKYVQFSKINDQWPDKVSSMNNSVFINAKDKSAVLRADINLIRRKSEVILSEGIPFFL